MSIRIALASSDGKMIDRHFGHAEQFYVADVEEDGWRFVALRQVERACVDYKHGDGAFEAVFGVLSDCRAVFVNCIGQAASAFLIGKGMRVFETEGAIADVLDYLVNAHAIEEGGGGNEHPVS